MTKKYGILAYPAKHSLSPVMHNAAFRELGIDAQYGSFEIPENGLDDFMKTVKHEPIHGLSVSLPYKETVMNYINEIDDDAKKIGAVNTVVNRGGFLYGYNTDFLGSNLALKEELGDLNGKEIVVVGAGGAARAVVYGLLKEGAKVSIFNRHKERADELRAEFSEMFGVEILSDDLENIWKIEKADALIQTTSIWIMSPDMNEKEAEKFIPKEYVDRYDVVMDIVYKPLLTPLIKMANSLGRKTVTGDKMLLHQATEQFRLFTGKDAPVEVMRGALGENLV